MKKICIAIDEMGGIYDKWISEIPKRIREKYQYMKVNSQSEALILKEKLQSEGKEVFTNYLSW